MTELLACSLQFSTLHQQEFLEEYNQRKDKNRKENPFKAVHTGSHAAHESQSPAAVAGSQKTLGHNREVNQTGNALQQQAEVTVRGGRSSSTSRFLVCVCVNSMKKWGKTKMEK